MIWLEKATPRQRVYNEIYPSIIEKQKIIDVHERSTYQLLEQYTENDSGELKKRIQLYSKRGIRYI